MATAQKNGYGACCGCCAYVHNNVCVYLYCIYIHIYMQTCVVGMSCMNDMCACVWHMCGMHVHGRHVACVRHVACAWHGAGSAQHTRLEISDSSCRSRNTCRKNLPPPCRKTLPRLKNKTPQCRKKPAMKAGQKLLEHFNTHFWREDSLGPLPLLVALFPHPPGTDPAILEPFQLYLVPRSRQPHRRHQAHVGMGRCTRCDAKI